MYIWTRLFIHIYNNSSSTYLRLILIQLYMVWFDLFAVAKHRNMRLSVQFMICKLCSDEFVTYVSLQNMILLLFVLLLAS